jgi:hypothetical protein
MVNSLRLCHWSVGANIGRSRFHDNFISSPAGRKTIHNMHIIAQHTPLGAIDSLRYIITTKSTHIQDGFCTTLSTMAQKSLCKAIDSQQCDLKQFNNLLSRKVIRWNPPKES